MNTLVRAMAPAVLAILMGLASGPVGRDAALGATRGGWWRP